jgi:hypothetical protein
MADVDPGAIAPPSISEARELISKIRTADLRATPVEQIVDLVRPLLKGHVVAVPNWEPGLELFRASSRFDQPPASVKEMWHPPPDSCSLGRANLPHQPLLYCAADIGPLFFELSATEGTRLSLIKFETTDRMIVNRVGYTPEVFASLKSSREVPDYGVMNVTAYSDVGKMINDFLSEVFCQVVPPDELWRYSLSASIARALLGEAEEPINGVMYPTIPMWGNADNFALKPRYALDHLRPVHAQFVEVTKVALPEMSFDILDEARRFEVDGTICWLGHQGKWEVPPGVDQLLFEAAKGGYWLARDSAGRIVDPN